MSSPAVGPARRRPRGLRPVAVGIAAGLILSAGSLAVAAWPTPQLSNAPNATVGTVVGAFTPAQVDTLLPTPGAVAFQTITITNTGTLGADYTVTADSSNNPFSLTAQGAALAVKSSAVSLAPGATCGAGAFPENPQQQLLIRFTLNSSGQLAVGATQSLCLRLERDKGQAYTGDLTTTAGKTSAATILLTATFKQPVPPGYTPLAAPAGTSAEEASA